MNLTKEKKEQNTSSQRELCGEVIWDFIVPTKKKILTWKSLSFQMKRLTLMKDANHSKKYAHGKKVLLEGNVKESFFSPYFIISKFFAGGLHSLVAGSSSQKITREWQKWSESGTSFPYHVTPLSGAEASLSPGMIFFLYDSHWFRNHNIYSVPLSAL